ncbi:MAG: shikimate dehydrogenase [Bacteroidales bacterium]|nr:shikimate dehydrogenase [Bacteroidales bacterium]
MRSYGLIGHPLKHSYSKDYFENKFRSNCLDCKFDNFDIESLDMLENIIDSNPELQGFTVTHPYKNEIIGHLDFIDENAEKIGAVNAVKIDSDRKLHGFNTDYIGFQELLKDAISEKEISRAIVCGTGGASKAVQYTLKKMNIDYQTVTRHSNTEENLTYTQLKAIGFHDNELIINATPLGMHPNVNECADIPYDTINSSNVLIDLIYNPGETLFLKKGATRGASTYNGLKMLHIQADAAWSIWNKEQQI